MIPEELGSRAFLQVQPFSSFAGDLFSLLLLRNRGGGRVWVGKDSYFILSVTLGCSVLCLGPATEGTFPEDTDCSGGPQTVGTPSERRFASVMRDSPLCIILRCAGAQTSATVGTGRK